MVQGWDNAMDDRGNEVQMEVKGQTMKK